MPVTPALSSHRSRLPALLLLLLAAHLTACDKDEPASTSGTEQATAEPTDDDPARPGSTGDAAEDLFLAELAEFTEILVRDAPPSQVAEAFEAHYREHEARIVEVARTLQTRRASMTADELDAFETELAARQEAAAFTDALELFQARAGADYRRVEDVMLDIYRAAGIEP